MSGQRLEVGSCAVDEVEHQAPAEDQQVPMAKTRPQYSQALCNTLRQTGQGHGLGLLVKARSGGHSRACIPGSAWTVKDFHLIMSKPLTFEWGRRISRGLVWKSA